MGHTDLHREELDARGSQLSQGGQGCSKLEEQEMDPRHVPMVAASQLLAGTLPEDQQHYQCSQDQNSRGY